MLVVAAFAAYTRFVSALAVSELPPVPIRTVCARTHCFAHFVPTTVTIEDTSTDDSINHKVTYIVNGKESAEGVVTITNYTGTVLPSTGGIGTTIFYVVGAMLVIGAGVVLVTRRRMDVQ